MAHGRPPAAWWKALALRTPVDSDALEDACRRLGPAIFRRCLKLLRDPAQAEDACQQVFLQLIRHREALPPRDEQLRWAYVIATRVCFTRMRDGAWEIATGDGVESGLAAEGDTFQGLADRELAQKALAHATLDQRMVAWLVLVDGHTQEEAANLLGLSRKTVGKRISLFLQLARRLLTG